MKKIFSGVITIILLVNILASTVLATDNQDLTDNVTHTKRIATSENAYLESSDCSMKTEGESDEVHSLELINPPKLYGLSLSQLRTKYPHGKYWNHKGNPGSSNAVNNPDGYTSTPCSSHGDIGTSTQTCNGFTGGGSIQLSWQCMGFAEQLGYLATGYNPRNNANGWYTNSNSSALDSLKAGDIVRYKNNNHSIYVIAVNGDIVTYADCNSDGHCIIRWDATISKSTLRATFTNVRVAPFAMVDNCSCSTSYAGYYTCTTASANLNIRSGHGSGYSVVGSIPSGATVYVSKASGTSANDWAHVEYNGISGFASMEYLSKQGSSEISAKISYWISYDKMGDSITSAKQGDWVYLCYRMYDANSGKNLNEVTSKTYTVKETIYKPDGTIAHTYTYNSADNNWIGAGCYVAGTYSYKVELSGDWSGTYTGTFTVASNPKRINASTTNVNLTLGGTESTTIYVWTSGYHDGSCKLKKERSNSNISSSWGEWNDEGKLPVTITANSEGTTTLTLYVYDSETEAVLHSITVNVTVTAKSYTVSYNANGGSGAPSSQTKRHGTSMTLSDTVPDRLGYTFLGWSTSSSATSASYTPGSTFSTNANTTLYAVWQSASTISSGVTNSSYSTSISFADGCKYYSFTPSYSGKYRFESSGDKDTKVYIYNSAGSELTYNDDGGSGNNFLLTYNFTSGTKYYVKVKMYGSGTGTVSFTVKRVYDVTYNSNGGSGAPSAQEKVHGSSLTLSTIKPTRSGYTFMGWATSSTATSAEYSAGGSYTANSSTTLYAVWKRGCEDSHSYSYKTTKNPTTSATGTLTGTCSKCSGTTSVTLPKLDTTNYSYSVTKAATCTADGTGRYTWKTTTYGTYSFDVTIAKLGHSYTTKVTKPSCTAQGYTTHTCSRCSNSYKDTYTNATGHSEVVDPGYPATCTADGLTDGKHCSTCGIVTLKQITIPAMGHIEVMDYGYQATCTASGLTDGKHCSICGTITMKQTVIPATGHSYDNGTCSNCGHVKPITRLDNVTINRTVAHSSGNIIYWDAVENGDVYQIYRLRSGETSWTLLKNTRSLGYKDETAVAGIKYYYKIVARNGDAKSDIKTTVSVGVVRPSSDLENVTIYKTIGHSTGNILYWNAVANAKIYQVYRLEDGQWVLLKNTGSLGYKDETARSGVKYYYKIVARNGDVKSDIKTTVSASATRP